MRTPTPTRQGASAGGSRAAAPAVKQLSRDEWSQKMGSIIDEFIHTKDLKVSLHRFTDLGLAINVYTSPCILMQLF